MLLSGIGPKAQLSALAPGRAGRSCGQRYAHYWERAGLEDERVSFGASGQVWRGGRSSLEVGHDFYGGGSRVACMYSPDVKVLRGLSEDLGRYHVTVLAVL